MNFSCCLPNSLLPPHIKLIPTNPNINAKKDNPVYIANERKNKKDKEEKALSIIPSILPKITAIRITMKAWNKDFSPFTVLFILYMLIPYKMNVRKAMDTTFKERIL